MYTICTMSYQTNKCEIYKYATFLCFRSGAPAKYESKVEEEFQRTIRELNACFKIHLKQMVTNGFEVTEV